MEKGSTYFFVIAIIAILTIQAATTFYVVKSQVQVTTAYKENANKHILAYSGAEKAVELINSTLGDINVSADAANVILTERFNQKNIYFNKGRYSFTYFVGNVSGITVTIEYKSPNYNITSTVGGSTPAVVNATATLQNSKIVITSIKKIQKL